MSIDTETILDIITEVVPYEDADNAQERLAHIIDPPCNPHIYVHGMKSQDIVDIARMTGQEVIALCGYHRVPMRNPEKYPVCRVCIALAGMLMRNKGE